ncbi:MAG: Trp family transcriptional regulator [candidate division WWE3 bacterium]|nr:Trp family transcriptional regulator [candidate division WWE3 bacterium]
MEKGEISLMSQVSKRLLDPKIKERLDVIILDALSGLRSPPDAHDLIQDLLTPTEQEMIKKRIGIAVLLEKGYDHRTIAEVLRVSTTTVNRVSLWLKFHGKGYRKIAKRLIGQERWLKIFKFIDDTAYELMITPYHTRSVRSRRRPIARRTPL